MSGICLTVDTDRQIALNELISNDLSTTKGLELLTESAKETNLITDSGFEWIKKSIEKGDSYGLIPMIGYENKEKLFELALIKSNMWLNKNELTVFIKPHTFDIVLNKLIQKFSNEWTPFSGIGFKYVDRLPADIIIELNGNWVHSSLIGKNSLTFSQSGLTTMQLGIGIAKNEDEIRRPVIHEFGHALGCIHEHQSPASSIKWNEPYVIRCFSLSGWDKSKVRHNVFNKFSSGEITNSKFDPNSIMIYPIDKSFTLDGFFTNWNTHLSDLDKEFIKRAYSIK